MLMHCFLETVRTTDMFLSKGIFNLFHRIIPPIIAIDSTFIPKGSTSRVKRLKNKRQIQTRKEPVINKKLIFNQVSVTLLLFGKKKAVT